MKNISEGFVRLYCIFLPIQYKIYIYSHFTVYNKLKNLLTILLPEKKIIKAY